MQNRSVAKNLVYQRKLKGCTQEALADKTSVTVRTIQRIEKGEVNPQLHTLKLLAAALDIGLEDLLPLEHPKEESAQKKWLLLLHSSPLLGGLVPFLNILVPLFIWMHKREDHSIYDRHGKAVINFHITISLIFLLSLIALVTVQGYGFLFFICVISFTVLVMLANIISAVTTKKCYYPLAIPFLSSTLSKEPPSSTVLAVAFMVSLLSLAGSEPASAQSASDSKISDEKLKVFSERLNALREEKHIPGLAVAIVENQKLAWSTGYGSSHFDIGDGNQYQPVTSDTPFWVASVSKTFVGLLFLQLHEQEVVNLDSTINEMPQWGSYCNWLAESTIVFGQNLQCDQPITLRNVLNHTVNGDAGASFLYNPIMYSRLSRYLEYVHGNPIAASEKGHNTMAHLTQKNILGPAGMQRTMSSQWQREKAEVYFDMARGYKYADGRYAKRMRPDRHFAGGAGIVSTVDDLAKYDIALDRREIASESVMEQLFTPAVAPDGSALPYAYGWYVQEYQGEELVWHGGWDEEAGFSALYLKVPERNLTFIVLANSEGMWWGNPLDKAQVEGSEFAQLFLEQFVLPKP